MPSSSLRRLLVVDDEEGIRSYLRDLLEPAGWTVHEASSGTAGIEKLENERYDVVLTDLKMPGPDGLEVLRTAKAIQPDVEVILMTGFGTVDTAVEAMRAGAFHYLLKPFRSGEALLLADRAYAQRHLKRENLFLRAEAMGKHRLQSIVGTSPAIQAAASAAQRLADTDTPVLFEGERGTGRRLFAKIIHYASSRAGGLFVPVRCGGAPDDVVENDLFGHAAGAYRQSSLQMVGKVELSSRGTLFLEDIHMAGPGIQDRILRLLTAKTTSPVGSAEEVEVDVRVVASSLPGLGKPAAKGAFLAALRDAFRPGGIRLPSLRERTEDIPLLLHHHLFEANRDRRKPLQGFSEAAVAALSAYSWPGNVRELIDLVKTVSARKKQGTVVSTADLPPEILYGQTWKDGAGDKQPAPHPDIRRAIDDLEKPMVRQALALAQGDRRKAAELLHIGIDELLVLLREHSIEG